MQLKPAKKLTTNKVIKSAHNWLFFTITKNGILDCSSMVEIVFYGQHHGGQLKDNPNGKKALARYSTNQVFASGSYMQPLPPNLDRSQMSVQIYFFMDEDVFIQIDNFDFNQKFEGESIIVQNRDENDPLYYVNIGSLFSVAAANAEPIAISDPSQFKLVQKGKSAYKVFDLGGGQFKIARADTGANVNPTSPTGRGILKLYGELSSEG